MDEKKHDKGDGNSSKINRKIENGHIGAKKSNQSESALPGKKPGFYKNPNIGSNSAFESSTTNQSGSLEALKRNKQIVKLEKEHKPDKSTSASSDDTGTSSGIDCGVSEKTDSNFDSASVGSGSNTNIRHEGHERVIHLCVRGEWILLDQHLRNVRKAHPSLSKAEQVIS